MAPDKTRILTKETKKTLLAKGYTILRERQTAGRESPFEGRDEWIVAVRTEPEKLPPYFACGHVAEPSVYYFEEEEPDSLGEPDSP